MAKLHLVDATYELFRAFTAVPSRRAPDGAEVAAVGGLIATLLKLLREPDVTHVACATDHVIESFRNQLFAGYKTGAGIPPDLWSQFPLAEEAIEALGLVLWPMVEFEADDALAAAAHRWAGCFEQVLLCTPDKDLAQCVRGAHVVLWDRRRELVYDEPGVIAKWGVPPAAIPDYLALVGDSADGIPGVPRWGAKSSAAVLSAHGSLERIPARAEDWGVKVRGAAALAASLEDHRAAAALYKRLATLRTDAPLPQTLGDLEWRGVRRGPFLALCERLGLDGHKERPHRWQD
ncbi:MAG: 5'-3' exonuclease H3TH domain-containing protein [Planctomycetota bacterium]